MGNCKGFTLVEMLVAMGMFVIVMVMGTYAFERVLGISSQQSKSSETNIEGMTGLELLRYDVEHAGYGLPWRFQNYTGTIQFKNATGNLEINVAADGAAAGFDANQLNAVASTNIQPIAAGSATKEVNGANATNAAGGPDYLVIRSTMGSLAGATRKWSYVNYSSSSGQNVSFLKSWQNSAENFVANDRIVTVSSTFTTLGKQDKILLMNGNDFEVALPASLSLPAGEAYKPSDSSQIVVAYGLRNAAASTLRMPYYRTDYFVSRPATGMPPFCNPGTGLLYKAVVSQDTGAFNPRDPVLDCVGDLQVEFEYDANDDGNISYLPPASLAALSASDMRDHLKNVRVYILAHEGKKDRNYSYPGSSIQIGDARRPTSSGRTLSSSEMAALFGADWRQYRWKIYTIVTRPKNLAQ